jgi:N-acyl-D-amino-acid deacylase
MYSLLIKNATVIDGTGTPGKILDIAIEGDKIVNLDKNIPSKAIRTIDASNLVVSPGFIDLQNHSDTYWQIFENPTLDSLLFQGFTSIIIGNCGASLAPLLSHNSLLSSQKWHNLQGINTDWQTFNEFLTRMEQHKIALNVGSLVGYSTLRRGIVGDQIRSLDKPEFKAITKTLIECLENGAFGLSSGLSYSHEIIVSELELFELAKIIKNYHSLLSIHLRNEGDEILESIEEVIDIAKNAEVNLKISHLKVKGKNNWKKFNDVISDLETAFHRGANIHFDVYPYDTVWQPLYSYLPKWSIEGGRKNLIQNLNDPIQKKKILIYLNGLGIKLPELIVASTGNPLSATGKKVGQIAKNMECSSEQAIIYLIQHGGSEVLVFENNLNMEQVRQLLFHPLSLIGTDGAGFGLNNHEKLVHPRCFGTTIKFLELMKEAKLPLEVGIKKLTSLPAKKAGIKHRGEIQIDNYADLVIFDPEKLKAKANYVTPFQTNEGIKYVVINGHIAMEDNKISPVLKGKVLRK